MRNKTLDDLSKYFKRRKKLWIIVLAIVLMSVNYLTIINIRHNHLSFTHLMYIPVVILGTTLGSVYGLVGGIVVGLLVGPLMPYNLDTGQGQYIMDWIFRLSMFSIVGLISGFLSRNIQKTKENMKILCERDQDSKLYNLNYLRSQPFKHYKNYVMCTMLIGNHESIQEVNGYETYYEYLRKVEAGIKAAHPSCIVVTPNIDKIWMIIQKETIDQFKDDLLKVLLTANILDHHTLFVDYALGFSTKKLLKEHNLIEYFTNSDLAAREALSNHIVYLTYSDIKTNKQFEYELLSEFSSALGNGQIYMVYQPIIDLKTGKPKAIEALIRWEHPTKKSIRPDQFIPAVEQTSMIHDMTLRVFDWVLKFATTLLENKIVMQVSINISTKNLYDDYFFVKMTEVFSRYQIKPQNVELEITETVLMDNPEISKRVLEKFATFGFRIAIDDFGKGYSSLAYLAQFPINVIKIDRIFTSQVLINPATQTIVKATIDLAKQLGYEVLIEGVEDFETADMLTKMGCNSAQGYFYMRPSSDEEMLKYLKRSKS
ncbi:MAG: hypothetical protein CVV58_04870 [Tenericutes bacterium HGW-Tenericutes-3]|nr:MAG: hypothetical protein CVV58_04870 [Tenericutes bacterium HGW-Tenericutes-3]